MEQYHTSLDLMKEEHTWNEKKESWNQGLRLVEMQQRLRASMKDDTITPREMTICAKMLDHCLNAMEDFMQHAPPQPVHITDSFDQSQAI
eukprot:275836-Hanusia_phi.AAC.1